jgi:hypothetical protein
MIAREVGCRRRGGTGRLQRPHAPRRGRDFGFRGVIFPFAPGCIRAKGCAKPKDSRSTRHESCCHHLPRFQLRPRSGRGLCAGGRGCGARLAQGHALPAGTDIVGIPGGFSFGDYLRCGAIAARSPIAKAVVEFAGKGGHVLGICNGFQVLLEMGLLPGALMRNANLRFICKPVGLRVETTDSAFTSGYAQGAGTDNPDCPS